MPMLSLLWFGFGYSSGGGDDDDGPQQHHPDLAITQYIHNHHQAM